MIKKIKKCIIFNYALNSHNSLNIIYIYIYIYIYFLILNLLLQFIILLNNSYLIIIKF